MTSPNHPTSDIEDAFSFNFHDYISASLDYFLASPRNISHDSSNDLTKYLLTSLAISPYHNDSYIIQAYDAIPPPQAIIALPAVLPLSSVLSLPPMFDYRDFFFTEKISPPKDTETPVKSPFPVSPSLSNSLAFCLGKTLPVSKPGCVLCQDCVAFCLEDLLRFVSRPLRFVSSLSYDLSQDLLRFVSSLTAFCLQSVAFCLQASCVLSTFEDFFLSFEKDRYNADIRATNILLQGLPKDIYTLINHYTDAKDIWDNQKGEKYHDCYVWFAKLINDMRNIKMTMSRLQLNSKFMNNMLPEWGQGMNLRGGSAAGYGGAPNKVRNVNPGQARPGQARPVKCYNCNGTGHITRICTQPKRPQNSEYYKDKMLLMQAQENGVALDEEQLLFLAGGQDNAYDDDVDEIPVQDLALNVDNVFQDDDCDAFDFDVDEASTAQTMFMANLSSADPATDEVEPSYDPDIISEVQDHDHYQDAVCAHHEEHVTHDSVQLNHVIDSHADYTSDSNMILYDQYVKDNEVEDRLIKQDQSLQTVHMLCRPKPYYNELNKVAIGYKNPLCLTHAKQVQPTLYNGHEIIKDNHAPAIVHNTEDTLEIAEINRKKMNAKINDPECVTRKVKIAPHDYSKENFLSHIHTSETTDP
nr:hypothetical protein [Tanacetum cinerariifolium]